MDWKASRLFFLEKYLGNIFFQRLTKVFCVYVLNFCVWLMGSIFEKISNNQFFLFLCCISAYFCFGYRLEITEGDISLIAILENEKKRIYFEIPQQSREDSPKIYEKNCIEVRSTDCLSVEIITQQKMEQKKNEQFS